MYTNIINVGTLEVLTVVSYIATWLTLAIRAFEIGYKTDIIL